jgi:CTP:molybdopterin cytidylyltransferase MocA
MGGTNPAAVVLAAGEGRRLRPLTTLRPKALCPVGGTPLLDLALDRVERVCGTGADVVAVNAHHHRDQVVGHVGGRAHLSVEEPVALGTAGALGLLRPWLAGRDVLVTNADAYLATTMDELVAGFDGERCRLLVRALPPDEPGDFRLDGTPVRYVGACVLPWGLAQRLPAEPGGLYEALWRDLDAASRLDLHVTTAHVVDCGTPADYLAANLHASGGRSVVGEGAVVQGRIERCVVWDGAHVGPDEVLTDVVRAGDRAHPLTVAAG